MAELDVQRKKKSPLPWILLIIAILAVLAYFLLNNNNDAAEEGVAPVTYDSTQRTGADSLPR
ncbi:MAG TPA: hypothetical protein VGB56_14670 [Flavisolibacter sp.]|jgi:uncharacterized phage infection (PIP) family protein YhgE